jgi:hypothetical protein
LGADFVTIGAWVLGNYVSKGGGELRLRWRELSIVFHNPKAAQEWGYLIWLSISTANSNTKDFLTFSEITVYSKSMNIHLGCLKLEENCTITKCAIKKRNRNQEWKPLKRRLLLEITRPATFLSLLEESEFMQENHEHEEIITRGSWGINI